MHPNQGGRKRGVVDHFRLLAPAETSLQQFRLPYEVAEGPGLHLLHSACAMKLDHDFADSQFVCRLFVHETFGDELHDLPLTWGETGRALAGMLSP